MSRDYITTDTEDWVYKVFCKMSDSEFATELNALKSARSNYLHGGDGLVNSIVFEYLDNVYEIARDSLCTRFLDSACVTGCVGNRA